MQAGLRALVDCGTELDEADVLLRVVQPKFQDGSEFTSNAFQDQSEDVAARWGLGGPCASVAVVRVWRDVGGSVRDLLDGFDEGSRLAAFTVGDVRNLRTPGGEPMPHGVMLDPRNSHAWHAVIFDLSGRARGKGGRRALSKVARWADLS